MSRYLNISSTCILASGLMLAMFVPLQSAEASAFKVLYTFQGAPDAGSPQGGVIADKGGNLYGAAFGGAGHCGCGSVFEVAPNGTETVLFSWTGGQKGGSLPSSGLAADGKGNLYGTTGNGGTGSCGCGVVYKVSPSGKEDVLYSFKGGSDGFSPLGGLIRDNAGNFYGTTEEGGGTGCSGQGCGTVFKVTKTGTETVLYSFCAKANCADGAFPVASLIVDANGNLYGTTVSGGVLSCPSGICGTVFKIAPDGTETILHAFTGGNDGETPNAALIMDGLGNIYSTTQYGGAGCAGLGCGTVFKLAPDGTETILYAFKGGNDGQGPSAALADDGRGSLYGTTSFGGGSNCGGAGCGTVFKLAPDGAEKVLRALNGGSDGAHPDSTLILMNGYLYGTAAEGGGTGCNGNGCGTVFSVRSSEFTSASSSGVAVSNLPPILSHVIPKKFSRGGAEPRSRGEASREAPLSRTDKTPRY